MPNQSDYAPGVPVVLTGAGWAPGERVHIEVVSVDEIKWQLADEVAADAGGNFVFRFTLPDVVIALYNVVATGPVSGTATTSFTDSPGSYSLKWYAADPELNKAPYLPTYNKIPPAAALPYPVGRANDPLRNAVAYGPTSSTLDAQTSLHPKTMALGQIVPFMLDISVTGSTAPENGTITFKSSWLTRTANGGDFGFDPGYGLIAAFVDSGDAGTADPLANARVSGFSWARANAGTSNEAVEGTVTVTGLDNGDRVVVELWVVLKSTIPAGTGSNVETSVVNAVTGPSLTGGSAINAGNQPVRLTQVSSFLSATTDLAVTKTDTVDPVMPGQDLTYAARVTNNSTDTVANGIVLTDTLPSDTTFSSGTWPGGTCTASGGIVTCAVGALSPQQSVTVTIVVTVSTTAPFAKDTSTGPRTGTCTAASADVDLCNRATVSLTGVDPTPANNSTSEPTNLVTGSVTLAKLSESGAPLAGAQFRLYTGTPASPFNPASPGSEHGPRSVYTSDASGRIAVNLLPSGSFYFVEVAAPAGFMIDPAPVVFTITVGTHVRVEQATKTNWLRPAIEKFVTTSGRTADSGSYTGDLTWVLRPRLPGNIARYQSYVIEDELDPRLGYTGNLRISVGATVLVPGTHYAVTATPPGTSGGRLRITLLSPSFGSFARQDLAENTVVTFTTNINTAAVMGQAIPNTATVSYNDGISGSGSVASAAASAYTGGKVFRKVAESEGGTPLGGAQFKVALDSAGTRYVQNAAGGDLVLTSAADGSFFVKGLAYDLANGTDYYLVETVAPTVGTTSYNLLQASVPFKVTRTSFYADPTVISSGSTPPNAAPARIINKAGFLIPQTGGPGTLLISLVGLLLMGGAVIARRV